MNELLLKIPATRPLILMAWLVYWSGSSCESACILLWIRTLSLGLILYCIGAGFNLGLDNAPNGYRRFGIVQIDYCLGSNGRYWVSWSRRLIATERYRKLSYYLILKGGTYITLSGHKGSIAATYTSNLISHL